MIKKCVMCEAILDKKFPFNKHLLTPFGGHFIDTEGCIEEEYLQIFYCPVCGKELPCSVCRGERTIRVDAPVYPDAGSPTADIGSAPCPACNIKPKFED